MEELVHSPCDQGPHNCAYKRIRPDHGGGKVPRKLRPSHGQSTKGKARNEEENADEPECPSFDERSEVVVVGLFDEWPHLARDPWLSRNGPLAQRASALVEVNALLQEHLALTGTLRA